MKTNYLFAILLGVLLFSCNNAVESNGVSKELFEKDYYKNEQAFLKVVTKTNLQIDSILAKQYFKCIMDYYFSLDSNFIHLNDKEFTAFVKKHEDGVVKHCGKLDIEKGTITK